MCQCLASTVAFVAATFAITVGIIFNDDVCKDDEHKNATLPQWLFYSSIVLYAVAFVRADVRFVTNCCGEMGSNAYRITSMICGTGVIVVATIGAALLIIADDECKHLDLATVGGTGYSILNDTAFWLLDNKTASEINKVANYDFLWYTSLVAVFTQYFLGLTYLTTGYKSGTPRDPDHPWAYGYKAVDDPDLVPEWVQKRRANMAAKEGSPSAGAASASKKVTNPSTAAKAAIPGGAVLNIP